MRNISAVHPVVRCGKAPLPERWPGGRLSLLSEHKKSPPTVRPEGIEQKVGNAPRYSAIRISRILMAAVAIGVPGPKMAAAPSR